MFEIGLIIAVVVALVEFFKKMNVPVKYLPAVSLVLGIIAGFVYVDAPTVQEKAMFGVMIGLSAAGLFDQTKIVSKKGDE